MAFNAKRVTTNPATVLFEDLCSGEWFVKADSLDTLLFITDVGTVDETGNLVTSLENNTLVCQIHFTNDLEYELG